MKKRREIYVEAAKWDQNKSTTPYNYLEAANAYHVAGTAEKAEQYAQIIVDDYASSSQAPKAQKLLGRLMATNENN